VVSAVDQDGKNVVIDIDGSHSKAAVPTGSFEPGEFPAGWSADGRSLYVFRRGQLPTRVVRVDIASGRRSVWKELMPNDAAGVGGVMHVAVTPDGRFHAYSYQRNLSDLYLAEGVK
jgi:hypothetical protein